MAIPEYLPPNIIIRERIDLSYINSILFHFYKINLYICFLPSTTATGGCVPGLEFESGNGSLSYVYIQMKHEVAYIEYMG